MSRDPTHSSFYKDETELMQDAGKGSTANLSLPC